MLLLLLLLLVRSIVAHHSHYTHSLFHTPNPHNPVTRHTGSSSPPSSFLDASSAVMCSARFAVEAGMRLTVSLKLGDCPECPQLPPLSSIVHPGKIALTLYFEPTESHSSSSSSSSSNCYVATVIPVDLTVREDAADMLATSTVRTVYCVTSSIALTQQDV